MASPLDNPISSPPAAPAPSQPRSTTSKPSDSHIPPPEGVEYWLPKTWQNSDEVVATLFKCPSLQFFNDLMTGRAEGVAAGYFGTLWQFLHDQKLNYPSLKHESINDGKTVDVKFPINDFAKALRQYIRDPSHWTFVTDKPDRLIDPRDIQTINPLKYAASKGKPAWDVTVKLNQLKACRWILQPEHLGGHLNERGEFEGKSLAAWTLAFMLTKRMIHRAGQSTPHWNAAAFMKMRTNNPSRAPNAELVPVVNAEGVDTSKHVAGDEEYEEDVEIPIIERDMDEPPHPDLHIGWSPEDVLKQLEVLDAWLSNQRKLEDTPLVDRNGRNINKRPMLTVQQRRRAIAIGLKGTEIIATGQHERLAQNHPQIKTALTQAMQEFSMEDAPPESDSRREEWEMKGRALQDDVKRADFLAFQTMIVSGFGENKFAVDYVTACGNLHLNPSNPYWTIKEKRCGLKAWQVIGIDWLQRCRQVEGINPLLADDYGLGKTLQGLGAVYASYLDCLGDQPKRVPGTYRPSLVVCPRILCANWVTDNSKLLNNGLHIMVWAGRSTDSGSNNFMADRIIDEKADGLKRIIEAMDKNDPETARTVIITSYATGWVRSLLCNGNKVRSANVSQEAEDAAEDADEESPVEGSRKNDDVYSTLLEGLFERVICDESHKAKSTRTRTFRWLEALKPVSGYWFLSATPMPNNIEDLTCYLWLNWTDEWRIGAIQPEHPMDAIGWHSQSHQYYGQTDDDGNAIVVPADTDCPRDKAILDPELFRQLLRHGTMRPDISKRYLPAVLELMCMRRTMATMIDCVDEAGNPVIQRIGDNVPEFTSRTIELGYANARVRREHLRYQAALIREINDPGATEPTQRGGDVQGKRNMATHKRLQVMTLSAHLEPFTMSYTNRGHKAGVAETNTLQEYGHDKGLSIFQLHAQADPNIGVFSSRFDMACWLLKCSPKLTWLCDEVDQDQEKGQRAALFCQWPPVQWLIEGTFELLGLWYVSVRSEKTIKLRQEAIAHFTDMSTKVTALVASYATASLGLNIQSTCHKVIHVELPHNMSTILQANGRTHRLGQQHKQEFIILALDSSYDIPHMARIAHKYEAELAASLIIPADACLLGEQRPASSPESEWAVENFDQRYRRAVIADMYGQSHSVMDHYDVKKIPTFSKLFRDAPDTALDTLDDFGLGKADDAVKHIPLRAKRGAGPRTPTSKNKAGAKAGSQPSTSRKRKAPPGDEPASSPLATKPVKKTKRAGLPPGLPLSSATIAPEEDFDDVTVEGETPATAQAEDEDVDTAAIARMLGERAPTPTNGSPSAYDMGLEAGQLDEQLTEQRSNEGDPTVSELWDASMRDEEEAIAPQGRRARFSGQEQGQVSGFDVEDEPVPTPTSRGGFGSGIWSRNWFRVPSSPPSFTMNTATTNEFSEATTPEAPATDDIHQPGLLTGVGEMDFGGAGPAGQEPSEDDEITVREPKKAATKKARPKKEKGEKAARKPRARKGAK